MKWNRNVARKWTMMVFAAMLIFGTCEQASAFGVGSRGPDVFAVQGMLKSLGYYGGSIDGQYGPMTASGVRYFQQRYGLPQTGVVDNKTLQNILWAYSNLKIPPKAPPAPKAPPTAPPTKPTPSISEMEQRMIDLVNGERTKQGIKPLAADSDLSAVARLKSKDMVDKKYFSHDSPTYGSPFDMMKRFGIDYSSAGENIACNNTVEAAHKALMQSQGHRENILNPNFTRIGIGIVNGGPCGYMFTQQFVGK